LRYHGAEDRTRVTQEREEAGPARAWRLKAWLALAWQRRVRSTGRSMGPEAALTLVVLGVASAALAAPLATVAWLPFVDYPQHLGTIAAIHGQGSPTFDRYFVVEYARSQYLLLYVLGD
jgi:hypothetical protein